jgi:hypothetical protein
MSSLLLEGRDQEIDQDKDGRDRPRQRWRDSVAAGSTTTATKREPTHALK